MQSLPSKVEHQVSQNLCCLWIEKMPCLPGTRLFQKQSMPLMLGILPRFNRRIQNITLKKEKEVHQKMLAMQTQDEHYQTL